MPIAISGWISIAVAGISMLFAALLFGRNLGIESQWPELNARDQRIAVLEAANTVASAEALRRQQEAAQAAKAVEDEQRRRIEETEALVASYNALAELGAADYDKRLRAALKARAGRCDAADRARVPEATEGRSDAAEAAGLVPDPLSGNLGEFINGDVEGLNKQFHICYAAAYAGREISR
jgi:hypothetical protein